ncbi:MAG: PAS domain S-box protein, partial [Candidatus Bathyarchaeota archaeon]|nr:PAS domain S-box protein [Candidatus Bathyarchaeota archaeon]
MKAEVLQSILDAAKDAIFVIDVEGKVSYLNGAAVEMFGYPRGELMGESFHAKLVPERFRSAFIGGFRQFQEMGEGASIGETLELTVLRRDGSEFPVELSLSAVRVGDGWHAVGVVRDISGRKAVEEEQRNFNWALEERLKELGILYHIPQLEERFGEDTDSLFQGIVDIVPPAWQHPDVACARLTVGDDVFTSENFGESEWSQSSDVMVNGVGEGVLDVFYLEEMPEFDEGPFLKEERDLIDEITGRLGRFIERRTVEEELRESAEHYTTLFESISEPIMMIDPETYRILRVNESLKKQLKLDEGEIVGRCCYAVTHSRATPCEPPDDTCPLGELMETGRSVTVDHTHYDGEGGQFWTEVSVYPVLGEGGEISQVIHITRDISERKRIEEALTRSEEQYRRLWEDSGDGLVMLNPEDGGILDCNKEYMRQTGRSREQLLSMKIWELRPPNLREAARKRFFEVREAGTGASLELGYERPDGGVTRVDLLAEDVWIGGTRMVQIRTRDITRLVELRERFDVLMENAPDAIYLNDPSGTFIDGNRAAEELTGYSREELIGGNFLKLNILPAGQIPRAAKLLVLNRLGRRTGPDEFTLNRRGGGQVDVEISTYPVKLGEETVVMGIARDITERKEVERRLEEYRVNLEGMVEERTEELQEAKAFSESIISNALEGIAVIGMDGVFIQWNEAFRGMTGYSQEELGSLNIQKVAPGWTAIDEKTFERMSQGAPVRDFERLLTRRDGSTFPALLNLSLLTDEGGKPTGMVGFVRDETERKKMEGRLVNSERMSAAGRVAAMVGHDLRGPLSAISNAAYLIRVDPEDTESSLGIIEGSVKMAAGMLEEFRESTRDSPPVMVPVDLGALVGAAVGEAGVPEGVEVSVDVGEGLGEVSLDPGKIRRVLDNLIRNAVDAMPRGGELRVSAVRVGGE